ncbi:hypothetical protein EBM89_20065, partial [Cellulomonas triticagri]
AAPEPTAPAAASAPAPGGEQSSVDRPAAGAPERTAEQERAEHRAEDTAEPAEGDAESGPGTTGTETKES